jgi:thiol-disulfide isomerase/thioredoxin
LLLAVAVGGVVVGLVLFRVPSTGPSGSPAPDSVVATVDGEEITARDVDVELILQKRLHEQQGQVLTENPNDLAAFRRDILDQLVDQALIEAEAARQGIAVSEAEVASKLPSLGGGFDVTRLRAAALADGVTEAEFNEWARKRLVLSGYMQTEAAMTKVKAHLESTGRGLTLGVSTGDLAAALQADADVRFFFEGFSGERGAGLPMVREGHPAPPIDLATLAGGRASLAEHAGKPVLVNFWATWCVPCRTEMPLFVSLHQARAAAGLVVLAVDVQETAPVVQPFVSQFGLPFPVLLDESGEVATLYRVKGLPTSFFIGADGVVKRAHRGAILDAAQLDAWVSEILPPGAASRRQGVAERRWSAVAAAPAAISLTDP